MWHKRRNDFPKLRTEEGGGEKKSEAMKQTEGAHILSNNWLLHEMRKRRGFRVEKTKIVTSHTSALKDSLEKEHQTKIGGECQGEATKNLYLSTAMCKAGAFNLGLSLRSGLMGVGGFLLHFPSPKPRYLLLILQLAWKALDIKKQCKVRKEIIGKGQVGYPSLLKVENTR